MPNAPKYSGSALLCSPSKVQANKNRKEKNPHVHNRFSAKKASSPKRKNLQKPSLWDGKNRNIWVWIVKCDTTYPVLPDTLDSPAESVPLNRMSCILHLKYQNILCRNKSFILKQHRTRDTCNNETGHSYCHLKHAASLINYASWNPLLPMKEMSHMTLHLIAIWHLKRTIQHGMQLLSA